MKGFITVNVLMVYQRDHMGDIRKGPMTIAVNHIVSVEPYGEGNYGLININAQRSLRQVPVSYKCQESYEEIIAMMEKSSKEA